MPFDKNNIFYRNTCKDCEYERYCYFDPADKMFNRKCYVDYIAQKMKITPRLLLKRCNSFMSKYLIDFICVKYFDFNSWVLLSCKEQEKYVTDYLRWWLNRMKITETDICTSELKLCTAMINTYFNCWRNDEYIRCARCGKIVKNSKQRNRRFCEDCIGYQKKDNTHGFCLECGEEFLRESNNQYRCSLCQKQADKLSARERARRYRERKRNDSELKS